MPAVAAMDFWAHILPDAMKMFLASVTEEPELFRKKGYSIRDKHSWDDIYAQLQLAREHYDGNKKGFWGKVKSGYRRAYRTAADNSGILGQALKALPDQDLVSPVKAVLEVLLDVSALSPGVTRTRRLYVLTLEAGHTSCSEHKGQIDFSFQ